MSTFLLNKKYLPHRVGVCFIIGIIAGLFFHDFSIWVKPAGDLFMNMIKMLIVPVIFFSVTSGIAAIGDVQRLKRIGSKVVIVYFLMTVIACIVGIVMVNITHPGVGFTLDNMQAFDTSKVKTPSFVNFLFDMVPVNIVDSMAKNQIMQMIFFTVLVGVALVSLGEKVAGVTKIFDQCASIIYKMLDIVMLYSPIGVLALMANTTAVFGPKLFGVLAKFVFTDWVGCLLIWFFFSGIVWLYTKVNYLEMCKSMIPIWVNTIATNSSAGTIPITGAALYKTILAFFVAEIYGLQLTIDQILMVIIISTIMSIAAPGIPGGGIVTGAIFLNLLGLPMDLMGPIAGMYRLIDMSHTTVNVSGDVLGTMLVAKNENIWTGEDFNKTLV